MRRSRSLVTILFVALVTMAASPDLEACYRCSYSPHGWGFCRAGFDRGHGDCITKQINSFHGTTDCEINGWGNCYNGGDIGDGGGGLCPDCEPFDQADNSPCSWTDTEAIRLI